MKWGGNLSPAVLQAAIGAEVTKIERRPLDRRPNVDGRALREVGSRRIDLLDRPCLRGKTGNRVEDFVPAPQFSCGPTFLVARRGGRTGGGGG